MTWTVETITLRQTVCDICGTILGPLTEQTEAAAELVGSDHHEAEHAGDQPAGYDA